MQAQRLKSQAATAGNPASGTDTASVAGPDLSHVEDWIFDLDNTLYEQREGLLADVEQRICGFVQRHCDLPKDEAFALQKTYYHRYGNTLAGLMAHHNASPEDYLAYVNDVDVSALPIDERLAPALKRLPGRRFVFTNNCGRYAERVLERLGIASLFHDLWDIRTLNFAPKPNPAAYRTVIGKSDVQTEKAAMFEDMAVNLAPAHALGMTTVHVVPSAQWTKIAMPRQPDTLDHIHHYTDDIPHFLSTIEVHSRP